MTEPVFVDTNVLVYSRDSRSPAKHDRARAWMELLWETRRGRLSRRVLQEYYVTVTRNLRPGLPAAEARSDVRALFHWMSPVDPEATIEAAWSFQDRCSLSFWDALLLAAAQAMSCRFVLSEDLPVGQDLQGIRVVSPFATRPSELAC